MSVKRLSFANDITWWAAGEEDQAVAAKLSEAAAASLEWAADNGVAFDHGKTEAAFFQRKGPAPTASTRVGDRDAPFNQEATRWLGAWLDSQRTLKEHRVTPSG
jgi:hypothetical protein